MLLGPCKKMREFVVDRNGLRGPIPEAVGSMVALHTFSAGENSLSGPIPAAMTGNSDLDFFLAFDNQLSGSLPSGFMRGGLSFVFVQNNQLTGTLPVLKHVIALTASGNVLGGGPAPVQQFRAQST